MKKLLFSFVVLVLFSTNFAYSEFTTEEEFQNKILEKLWNNDAISAEELSNEYIQKYPNSSLACLINGIAAQEPQKAVYYLTIAIKDGNLNNELLTLAKLTRAGAYFGEGNEQASYNDCKNISEIELEKLPSDLQYLYFWLRTTLEVRYKKNYYAVISYASRGLKIKDSADLYCYRSIAFKNIGLEQNSKNDFILYANLCSQNHNSDSYACEILNEYNNSFYKL